MSWIWTHDVKSQQCIYFTLPYRIIAGFGACACNRKTMFWDLTENVGAPIIDITVNFCVPIFEQRRMLTYRHMRQKMRQYGNSKI